MEKRNYSARCHCGRVRFAFRSAPLTTGKRCNCSLCIRRGAVVSSHYIPAADFQLPDFAALTDYRWNDRVVGNHFCKTCGVFAFIGDAHYGYRVNLGCVEGLDALSLPIDILDGRSMPLHTDPGPHPGN